MQNAFYNILVPLEMGDIIQGQKCDTQYEILDIQHTYSIKVNYHMILIFGK